MLRIFPDLDFWSGENDVSWGGSFTGRGRFQTFSLQRRSLFFITASAFWSVKRWRFHVCHFMPGSYVAWLWTFPQPWSIGATRRTLFSWPLLPAHRFLCWENSLDCSCAPVHHRLEQCLNRLLSSPAQVQGFVWTWN